MSIPKSVMKPVKGGGHIINVHKLVEKIEATHELAVNAKTRSLQYAGYETGKKAHERYMHHEEQYIELMNALRSYLGMPELD